MTAEKFVNAVMKKVKCGKTKKREIKQQLLSDISLAVERGETFHEIMARMGSVQEMADEFNDNFSEEERKKYTRQKRIKIVLVLAGILLFLAAAVYWMLPKSAEIGDSGVFQQMTVEERIKEIIGQLDGNDYDALQKNAIEEMKPYLTDEMMGASKKQIAEDWGDCKSFGTVYMAEVSQKGVHMAVGEVTVAYENVSVTYRISLDEHMKLAGLYMR